jgi:DNA invertase Pin-like site-specific DNA recombinase
MDAKYEEIELTSRLDDETKRVATAVYVRVSTDKQYHDRQVDGLSKGLSILPRNFEKVGQYMDKETGKHFKRPEYKKMMGEVKAGRIKCVIVYDMTRFSRSVTDFHTQIEKFKTANCEIRLVKENLIINNDSNEFQRLIMNMLIAFSQFQREIIASTTKEGMASQKKRNPFIVYGQKPKLVGGKLREFISMYYERRPLSKRDSRREDPFAHTITDIGNYFGMGKSSISEFISKHVTMGTFEHRSPAKAVRPTITEIEGLETPKRMKKAVISTEKLEAIYHAQYWPQEVRDLVTKKFGNGYERASQIKIREAFEFGRQSFKAWLLETVRLGMIGGELTQLEPEQLEKVCEELSFREREPTEEEHQANIREELMLDDLQDMSEEDIMKLKVHLASRELAREDSKLPN